MRRFVMGAAVGAAIAYLFDAENGPARRRQLQSLWEQNQDTVKQGLRSTTEALQRTPEVVQSAAAQARTKREHMRSSDSAATGSA